MKNDNQETTVPDKKEWFFKLASGSALFYLAIELVRLFFNEEMDLQSWASEEDTILRNLVCYADNRGPYDLDAACRAGDIFMGLVMDTDQEPDMMRMPVSYSKGLIGSQKLERTLLVYITEHSCLKNRWYQKVRTCLCYEGNEESHEEETYERLPTGLNIIIIDLENFQKQVPAPKGFLQQFLKILGESKTFAEARKALDTAVEKRYQDTLDRIAKDHEALLKAEARIAELKALLAAKSVSV